MGALTDDRSSETRLPGAFWSELVAHVAGSGNTRQVQTKAELGRIQDRIDTQHTILWTIIATLTAFR
jgi:hypothetical protein